MRFEIVRHNRVIYQTDGFDSGEMFSLTFRQYTDFLKDDRIIFNVGGNDYRIVTRVDYLQQALIIRWVGYHKDYDRIDASRI